MCLVENGNRILACQLGDLKAGARYRDPQGNEFIVTDAVIGEGFTSVVNEKTGQVVSTNNSLKLGHDKRDRLYASRYLNQPATVEHPLVGDDADEAKNQADVAYHLTDLDAEGIDGAV